MNNNATPRFRQENSFPSQFFDPKPARKPRNHSYVHTLSNVRAETRKVTEKPREYKSRSERLSDKNCTKKRLILLLDSIDEFEQADKLKSCGKFRLLTCESNHVAERQPLYLCSFRFCPFCSARRAQKFQDKYVPLSALFVRRFGSKLTPVHLTITQAHRLGEDFKQTRERLAENFRKLRRREFWKRHFAGGLVAFEATKSKDGTFHAHLHILGFRRRFFDTDLLRAEWLKVTGDSYVFRLKEITDLRAGLREVVKYLVKPQDFDKFSGDDMRQILKVRDVKNLLTIGEFVKFCATYEPTDDEKVEFARAEKVDFMLRDNYGGFLGYKCCPHPNCQKPLFERVFTLEQLIEFEKLVEKVETVPRL